MSEEIIGSAGSFGPLIAKIVAVIVGIGSLFAFSKTGENSYTFEIGNNLLILLMSTLIVFLFLRILEGQSRQGMK